MSHPEQAPPSLSRDLNLLGAVMLGLGSILGTGVFVSMGLAAEGAGDFFILALCMAALIALCNALSTAQLSARHPTSGGTYEYARIYLGRHWGFAAGWMFLCAKSASAATAAMGFAAYFLRLSGITASGSTIVAYGVTIAIVGLCLVGIKRTSQANAVIVGLTIVSLVIFVVLCWGADAYIPNAEPALNLAGPLSRLHSWRGFLEAVALLFVAYTGYGRVATLGEEISNPRRNLPRAIVLTLAISFLIYLAVAWAALRVAGPENYAVLSRESAAPLQSILSSLGWDRAAIVVAVGALTAMLGVLLNLVLGLSRIAFAMGRHRDMPSSLANVSPRSRVPSAAVLAVGVAIACLISWGDIRMTWSFSAFTVLFYYALTNASALCLAAEDRLYARIWPIMGLMFCIAFACFVDPTAIIWGLALLAVGFGLRWVFQNSQGHGE